MSKIIPFSLLIFGVVSLIISFIQIKIILHPYHKNVISLHGPQAAERVKNSSEPEDINIILAYLKHIKMISDSMANAASIASGTLALLSLFCILISINILKNNNSQPLASHQNPTKNPALEIKK